jgi:hypothetical protein
MLPRVPAPQPVPQQIPVANAVQGKEGLREIADDDSRLGTVSEGLRFRGMSVSGFEPVGSATGAGPA